MAHALALLTELSVIDRRLRDRHDVDADGRRPLEERRETLRRQVAGLLLATYDALDRAGRRPPLAAVLDGTCSGCNLRLPPQLAIEVRHGVELRSCPHCRRLLYASERAEGERACPEGRGRA